MKDNEDVFSRILTNKIVFIGNVENDIKRIEKLKLKTEWFFINIYKDKNTIDLSACINYMNTNKKDIVCFVLTSVYDKIREKFIEHGLLENIDFFMVNRLYI